MPQVSVTIAGRPYRMACGEGEEAHLQDLARRLDERIADLRKTFGEIGDGRITVMAALTMADQLSEAERRIARIEAAMAALAAEQRTAEQAVDAMSEAVVAAVDEAAARIGRVAQALMAGAPR